MITVIVPYKDAERYLGRCLKSLHDQDGDFEFLIVNDRSEDGGPEIAASYANKDGRFKLLDNERGPGVSGARNTGLDHAAGEWITFLDSDDEFLPGAYNTLTSVLKHEANVYQFNHMRWIARRNREIHKYQNNRGIYTSARLPEAWFGVWNKLFRGEFVKDIQFDERTQYGEDGLFILECLAKDDRILHADYKKRVCKHNLENKESLSHIKTGDDLLKQVHLYEEFMLRQNNPQIRIAVCNEISILWAHKRMKDAFGEGGYLNG